MLLSKKYWTVIWPPVNNTTKIMDYLMIVSIGAKIKQEIDIKFLNFEQQNKNNTFLE